MTVDFGIPNLPNYRALYPKYAELELATELNAD